MPKYHEFVTFDSEQVMAMTFRSLQKSRTALIHEDDLSALHEELRRLRSLASAPPPARAAVGGCFECGEGGDMHEHHVVPRSLGGKTTVRLCEACHGKIHGIDFQDHGVLVRKGLTKARRRGTRLGRPTGSEDPATILARHPDIVTLVRANKSLRDIAARTGKSQNTVLKVRRLLSKDSG